MPKISAVVITYNEERYIAQCISSVMDVADEVVVVDSFSTDRTPEICKAMGVSFYQQKFLGYREQKTFAMGLAKYNHILSLDADEALSVELRNSILDIKDRITFDGYKVYRLNNYCGVWMNKTSLYPEGKLRLFDRRKGAWGGVNPHDRFVLNKGSKEGFLKGHLLHWVYDSIEEHLEKINRFTSISAQEYFKLGRKAGIPKMLFHSTWRFFHSYVIKLGFLAGHMGYIVSRNLAYQTYLKYAKLNRLNAMQSKEASSGSIGIATSCRKQILAGGILEMNGDIGVLNPSLGEKKISIIITTYNQPEWLRKVLWGYSYQSFSDFELVIADDGSGLETNTVVEWFKKNTSLRIKHIWHPDKGYQKCTILNKAIAESEGDYLIFTDGDCIPRNDFVEVHIRNAKKGYFLSGGANRLPLELSHSITEELVSSQKAFLRKWLVRNGLPAGLKSIKLFQNPFLSRFMNFVTTARATWNGGNSSGWKIDIVAVNGFNEDLHYGGQDREFGQRLTNFGIKSRQIRYSAICLHLDHGRPYKTNDSIKKNLNIRKQVKRKRILQTPNGLSKHTKQK
jgi:glycosyltransferase involved in cell wall biosynthesis